jgi:hypothetical protein
MYIYITFSSSCCCTLSHTLPRCVLSGTYTIFVSLQSDTNPIKEINLHKCSTAACMPSASGHYHSGFHFVVREPGSALFFCVDQLQVR